MARDAELDRLKAAQDSAFQRKQDAYDEQQRLWEIRSSARDALSRAFEAKQSAYAEQDRTYQYSQSVRNRNQYRIDSLKDQHDRAHENKVAAFDRASASYERRDGMASSHSAEGHRYKEEAQRCITERRSLIAENQSAWDAHLASKPAFQRAKSVFDATKRAHDTAKANHERAQEAFKRAKGEFDKAQAAFQARLAIVKGQNKLNREKDKRLAERAGVPFQHLDTVVVRYSPDGGANFYFGGVGSADGPGHGHIATDRFGTVTYHRDPFDPHGSHNFTNDPRWQRFDGGFAEALTYKGFNAIKESGLDSRTGRPTINIYYGGAGGEPLGKGHGHDVMYQDDPNTIVSERAPRR